MAWIADSKKKSHWRSRRYKNLTTLTASKKFWVEASGWYGGVHIKEKHRHYFVVYLWNDRESMLRDGLPKNANQRAQACVMPEWYFDDNYKTIDRPKVAEIHFCQGEYAWDDSMIVHEVFHLLAHVVRLEDGTPPMCDRVHAEEIYAWRMEQWFTEVRDWLRGVDPDCQER